MSKKRLTVFGLTDVLPGVLMVTALAAAPSALVIDFAGNQIPGGCAAYRYTAGGQNICDRFAGTTKNLNCPDIKFMVYLPDANDDPWGLDKDHSGTGCENYGPGAPKPKPTTRPATKPPTTKPTTKPTTVRPTITGTQTSDPTPVQTVTEGGNTGGNLPVTGPGNKVKTAAIAGTTAVLIGGVLVFLVRRRRMKFTA